MVPGRTLQPGAVCVLGHVEDGFAHFSAIDPFLAHLPAVVSGQVVVVDEASGEVVATRHLGTLWHPVPRNSHPDRPCCDPAGRLGSAALGGRMWPKLQRRGRVADADAPCPSARRSAP